MKIISIKSFILSISLLLLTSCGQSNTIIDYPSTEHQKLNENKKLWEKSNIQDYSFVVARSCFCLQEENKLITVSDGTVSEAKYIPSNTVLDISTEQKRIVDYFDMIQDALDKNAYKVTITYDKTYGFPSDIAIDYDEQIADEEIYYTLTHFQKGNGSTICTQEYKPVCAKVNVSCFTIPCETIEETFSNTCHLNANPNATYLRDGEC
ncbi:MAG: DUF6174 domain-containing protein [Sulfurovum sp.]|nr:DUF6174 domain-containing protein [Sulfurovum sp.]